MNKTKSDKLKDEVINYIGELKACLYMLEEMKRPYAKFYNTKKVLIKHNKEFVKRIEKIKDLNA